jgi:hypothetical protein
VQFTLMHFVADITTMIGKMKGNTLYTDICLLCPLYYVPESTTCIVLVVVMLCPPPSFTTTSADIHVPALQVANNVVVVPIFNIYEEKHCL